MDALFSIIGVVFAIILVAVALTFGFALLAFILSVAFVTALLFYLREWWYRWRFVRNAGKSEGEQGRVIEVEYKDITESSNREER